MLITITSYSQKGKTPVKKNVSKPLVLAKDESKNIQAEYFNKTIYVYFTENGKKDTLFTEKTTEAIKPDAFTLKSFKADNVELLLVGWNENISKKTDVLKEDVLISKNQIWGFNNKKRLVKNKYKSGSSEKIRYLPKHKDASETIYSKIKEGKIFSLLPNGDFTLYSDKGLDKFIYNATKNEYVPVVQKSNYQKNSNRRR